MHRGGRRPKRPLSLLLCAADQRDRAEDADGIDQRIVPFSRSGVKMTRPARGQSRSPDENSSGLPVCVEKRYAMVMPTVCAAIGFPLGSVRMLCEDAFACCTS